MQLILLQFNTCSRCLMYSTLQL